ncbi:RING-finger-containing ubiquitin ligase [Pyrenophora tritici-repentis]|uniref:RING-type E3 ubiquitin transferase n=2 Tax=Pyrenophora tritici-repentis TaxID=45151 RepID=A0A2W1EJ60_9PLEO|nr:RING-9 protein [Pyrenophora tritici-repentis Pt-1C-BFP]KAA8614472.1 hypothetical protein PtrV1_11502 [Pyrenophora tritici-repentis]EDU49834.1 RING-9 protein [Pyrenophora tritici-repentis Pt-1C-BFP]KAF7444304.1 RING-finger-containing ubiquitin ligase [Pyrenophora tritici-repentis]KAG9378554.1 RING-finger-containing ubiquitin ligase [Pyrenophora tritici-repentis]KAI0580868.1 RING-finger-containing ubiquitin ligase [Pyrenophora tritici-repentis]
MRPLRMLLSFASSFIALVLLIFTVIGTSAVVEEQDVISVASSRGRFKAASFFSSPGSLFPPSAIISLTDDNSTFFLARPAAFGPDLPKDGLSGPLWVGSGFGDDTLGAGELGCSDVPGWEDGNDDLVGISQSAGSIKGISKGDRASDAEQASEHVAQDDGTDDHLQPHIDKVRVKPRVGHADIQSLQESAEIAGKVVLLKRGGCGFLAKVQWAQSRGGKAVIVGDDVRGGALVRMYAKGDTSNITIPSLFTSHTTAHLLSSLLPSEGRLSQSTLPKIGSDTTKDKNQPSSAQASDKAAQTSGHLKYSAGPAKGNTNEERPSWLHSLLSMIGFGASDGSPKAGSRRLPNSGHLQWVEASDWDDDQKPIRTKSAAPTATSTKASDDFVIGEQDWRDPDLLPLPSSSASGTRYPASSTPVASKSASNVLPGSGEYNNEKATNKNKGWWRRSSSPEDDTLHPVSHKQTRSITSMTGAHSGKVKTSPHTSGRHHEGLWVTLTPTNVSTSPFFDTLLVLVVSPLVTLTVVYVLLLLRSRIRRRRWRAPKSVVERLPVRTYQTISEASSAATSIVASPTTPLLQHFSTPSRSTTSRSHSTIESEAPATSTSVQQETREQEEEKRESGLAAWRRRYGGRQRECVVCLEEYVDGVSRVMSLPCGHEFHVDCITPWLVTRRRTCPICKGDVVRTLSQSFHDRLQSVSPTGSPRLLANGDDVQNQAAEARNDSPSASRPVPMSRSGPSDTSRLDDDVEAGWSRNNSSETRGTELGTSFRELASSVSTVVWRGVDAVRNTTGLQRRSPPEDVDRNR